MLQNHVDYIIHQIFTNQNDEYENFHTEKHTELNSKIDKYLEEQNSLTPIEKNRIRDEFINEGPLVRLFSDESVTEILVNGKENIWFEKNGKLYKDADHFISDITYTNFIDRTLKESKSLLTIDQPIVDGSYKQFRLNAVGHGVANHSVCLAFRRHPDNPWTFERLKEKNWCTQEQLGILKNIFEKKNNFLIVGPTGSSKTSTINAFLQCALENERIVVIEDSSEIRLPNTASTKLLTRVDPNGSLKEIDQALLVKQSLRMRPDRIVMGEVRSIEAKDFLMAMATGHPGSFGTLHADDPYQALIRLEMLIQMGAPYWNLKAIRQLIQLSIKNIIVVGKNDEGTRKLKGVFEINSLEDFGFVIEKIT